MRADVYVKDVLSRCEALKRAGMWLPEPSIRPRAWIKNFESQDQYLAAQLLERFVFYSQRLTDSLLIASYYSIADGLKKGPAAPDRDGLLRALTSAVFTPVGGENPNPTDSGNFLCRRARQVLGISEAQILQTTDALMAAAAGKPIVFLDDFIGSGDQFLDTWEDRDTGRSFQSIHQTSGFPVIYVSLVGTDSGIQRIADRAPAVAICVTHKIDSRGTFWGIKDSNPSLYRDLDNLLKKYVRRLRPSEQYMLQSDYILYGYKQRGMFFGFEHSIPDATLPIFWCPGTESWEPLIERT